MNGGDPKYKPKQNKLYHEDGYELPERAWI